MVSIATPLTILPFENPLRAGSKSNTYFLNAVPVGKAIPSALNSGATYYLDQTVGIFTITLPPLAGNGGIWFKFYLANIGANNITITAPANSLYGTLFDVGGGNTIETAKTNVIYNGINALAGDLVYFFYDTVSSKIIVIAEDNVAGGLSFT